ncbi:hypothetical protein ABMA79_09600 [Halobacteriovorax sp. HFRX-2_2]|uniref:hypothetical protein n=1 Tax=unclassified Halobacteriovorax TaxID=2639665 RepID=UPI0037140253
MLIRIQDIIQCFNNTLAKYSLDIDYLFDTEKGFEKYIQFLLASGFQNFNGIKLLPMAQTSVNYEVIIDSQKNKVFDFALEHLPFDDDKIRIDFVINEKPSLYKHIVNKYEEQYNIVSKDKKDKIVKDFENSRFHYVELKVFAITLDENNNLKDNNQFAGLIKDCEKLIENILEYDESDVKSVIAMALASIYIHPEKDDFSWDKVSIQIKKSLKEKLDNQDFVIVVTPIHSSDNLCTIYSYRSIE